MRASMSGVGEEEETQKRKDDGRKKGREEGKHLTRLG